MEINSFWTHIFNFCSDIVTYWQIHKDGILAIFGGAAGLSLTLQTLLHKLKVKWNIDVPLLSYTLLILFSVGTALGDWWLSKAHPDPGVTFVWLTFLAQTWHRVAINPFYRAKFLPWLQRRAEEKQATANADAKAAATEAVTVANLASEALAALPAQSPTQPTLAAPVVPAAPAVPASPFEVAS